MRLCRISRSSWSIGYPLVLIRSFDEGDTAVVSALGVGMLVDEIVGRLDTVSKLLSG